MRRFEIVIIMCGLAVLSSFTVCGEDSISVGSFSVDATPPVGTPLAYDACVGVGSPLTARGIVIAGSSDPIVLVAVDWIGISNGGYSAWKEAIAEAVGTPTERVSVHVLHQHDAPRCDFSVSEMLNAGGYPQVMFDEPFARGVISRVAAAAKGALDKAQTVTHIGLGEAAVEKVASNRRILGEDGKVRVTRYTATRDPAVRAEPEGIIDPKLKSISFWNGDEALVVLTYYATHPQSYYRTGIASPDFPGMARSLREATLNGLRHVHFNGAGGNIGAGKYNDGSPENRQVLAVRMATGMSDALTASTKFALTAADVDWAVEQVSLPVAEHLEEEGLVAQMSDTQTSDADRVGVAKNLAWVRRSAAGHQIDIGMLTVGPARVLHMPGELAVEYQLAAQGMAPDRFVAMAAYGEYAPGYICMAEHYAQGGYEASPGASKVSPEVEAVLMGAMEKLLD